jgi:secreted trypsin-like serine protease
MNTFCFFVTVLIVFGASYAQQLCGIGRASEIFESYFTEKVDVDRILGGRPMKNGFFPWVVSVEVAFDGNTGRCTGTILSPNYILTAKHCTILPNFESLQLDMEVLQ